MRLAVVIPTVTGREDSLERFLTSLFKTVSAPVVLELLILKDKPTCGIAWREGAEMSKGADYMWYAADDIECTPGWSEPLIEAIEKGYSPTSVILEPDGSVQSAGLKNFTTYVPDVITDWMHVDHGTTPFMSWQQYQEISPMIPLHYCTDMWHSFCCAQAGYPTCVRSESRLIHHTSPVKRGADMGSQDARGHHDTAEFHRYVEMWPDIP